MSILSTGIGVILYHFLIYKNAISKRLYDIVLQDGVLLKFENFISENLIDNANKINYKENDNNENENNEKDPDSKYILNLEKIKKIQKVFKGFSYRLKLERLKNL